MKILSLALVMALIPLQASALFTFEKNLLVQQYQTSTTTVQDQQLTYRIAQRNRRIAKEGLVPPKDRVLRPVREPARPFQGLVVPVCPTMNYDAMNTGQLIKLIRRLFDMIVKD